jgi:hypothetical protein
MPATAHAADREDDRPDDRLAPYWREAAREFVGRLDDDLRKRYRGHVLPWERNVEAGQIDYWKVHAFALDRLDEILTAVLPQGDFVDAGTAWRGRHDDHAPWIIVSLMTGAWSEPATGKRGDDLVGLISRIYKMSPRRTAIRLAGWLSVEAVRRG